MCCVSLLLGNILKYTCKISSIVLVLKRKIIYKRGYFATTRSLVVRGCWRHSSLNFQESHVMLRRYICVDLFAERCLHFNRGGSFVNFVANDVTEWPGAVSLLRQEFMFISYFYIKVQHRYFFRKRGKDCWIIHLKFWNYRKSSFSTWNWSSL